MKNGKEKWILIHIEVQSTNEKNFAARMFQYFYRIYDKHDKKIVTYAIHTSPYRSSYADDFQYDFFGTKLNYAYNNYRLVDYSTEELEASDHIFSKVLLAAKYRNETRDDAEKRYTFKEHLIQQLAIDKRFLPLDIKKVIYFIDYLLKLPEELSKKLTTTLVEEEIYMDHQINESWGPTMDAVFAQLREIWEKEWMEEGIEKGIEKGLEQGLEQGVESVAIEMLKKGSAIEFISEVTGISNERIDELKKDI